MNYSDLYEAWKREKDSIELQHLEKKFFVQLSQHIKAQREELEMIDEKTLRGRLIAIEGNNIRKLFTSLVECRRYKIFKGVLEGKQIPSEFLTSEEEIVYSKALSANEEIDKINIFRATMKAFHLAIDGLKIEPKFLIIDGNKFFPYKNVSHACIVKGDSKYKSIYFL